MHYCYTYRVDPYDERANDLSKEIAKQKRFTFLFALFSIKRSGNSVVKSSSFSPRWRVKDIWWATTLFSCLLCTTAYEWQWPFKANTTQTNTHILCAFHVLFNLVHCAGCVFMFDFAQVFGSAQWTNCMNEWKGESSTRKIASFLNILRIIECDHS